MELMEVVQMLCQQIGSRKSNHQAPVQFRSHSIQTTSIELLDPENVGVAVGSLRLIVRKGLVHICHPVG